SAFVNLGGTASRAAAVGQIPGNGGSFTQVYYTQSFEGGAGGFAVNNNVLGGGSSAGLWHLSSRRGSEAGHSPTSSFYYGSETSGTYDTGARNAGTIISPVITLPAGASQLAFNYVMQTEGN